VADSPAVVLCPATFVELSAEQERCAIGALAELLVPLLGDQAQGVSDPAGITDVAPVGDT
jgi:hypothetical protein